MKRACCLYIIPVKSYFNETERELLRQKGSCYSFATQQGWSITKEIQGVDKIGGSTLYDFFDIIRDVAQNDEFEVLLISSYSLIEDCDTAPMFIQWLKTHEMEVWSAAEGQRRFKKLVDKTVSLISHTVRL